MALEKWLLERMSLLTAEMADKVKQFALEAISNEPDDIFTEIREKFACVGVWALQNPLAVFEAMRENKPFNVLVGMRPFSVFHLGHLTLMRELHWLVGLGGQPVFMFAGYEAGKFITTNDANMEIARFSETYLKFTGVSLPETTISFSDRECVEFQILVDRVAEHLSIRKILQLYGWDEAVSVATLRIPTITAATFLFPVTRFSGCPTLVLSDINQVTHAEAAKIVARQLKLPVPSLSYRVLLPSLSGYAQRMSAKNTESVVFLNDTCEQIANKLQRSFSGGRLTQEEQRKKGGDPSHCSFFRITEVLQPCSDTAQVYKECVSGSLLCGECKKKHIPMFVNKIHGLVT